MVEMQPVICPQCGSASEQSVDECETGDGVCPRCYAPIHLTNVVVGWDEPDLTSATEYDSN